MTPTTAQHLPLSDRCAGTNAAGEPCRATVLDGRDYCWHHAPDLEVARREARAKGGRHRSTLHRTLRRLPADLADVRERLTTALDDVLDGTLDHNVARAAASVAGVIVRIHEATSLDRIEELEELLEELEHDRAASRPTVHPPWEMSTR